MVSSEISTPPIAIELYIAETSASAVSDAITPTRSTAAGPTTIGKRCPHTTCKRPAMPVTAKSLCEKNNFSSGEPVATKTLVETTAMQSTNH
jgi:hypothetical protein